MCRDANNGILNHSIFSLFVLLASLAIRDVYAADQWQSNGDGTVTDIATGLIWQQQGDELSRDRIASFAYCADLTLGGNSNWRLPEVKEMISIVDTRARRPSIDSQVFPSTFNQYWTLTNLASNSFFAWGVNFRDGETFVTDIFIELNVRCVR